ncbi:hypothetical protein, partial [Helicobacter cinaedi]
CHCYSFRIYLRFCANRIHRINGCTQSVQPLLSPALWCIKSDSRRTEVSLCRFYASRRNSEALPLIADVVSQIP